MDWAEEATCHLTCPSCRTALAKPVAPPLAQVLLRIGVECDYVGDGQRPPPPPLTSEDLERFRAQLATFEG